MPETIVEWKPRPRNRVFIKLSGGRFFTVPESETLPRLGAQLDDNEIEQLSRVDSYFRGREKALRLIAIRPRTRHEIRTALDGLSLQAAIRDGIMEELIEQGLIDDERFAREFVRSRSELRRVGPHKLRHDLKKHGIHGELIESTLRDEVTGESQDALVRDVVRKRIGGRTPNERDIRRLGALLKRRGFDYEVINRVLYELLQQVGIDAELE